ncbi:glycosyltransferase family 4 protein [Maribacter sp. Asnod1-A12]|uniref:glycosyltransferase family 4 protein n=1 Tax=Maribacter sp. Asnod1-A12 TaxID=3160576 RepID=UPI0038639EB8
MKIVILSHGFSPDVGGLEIMSEFLANQFSKYGYEIRVLTWSTTKGIDSNHQYSIVRKPKLSLIIKNLKWADVIFENNPCLRLSWAALFFRKPHLIALHTWIARTDGKLAWQDYLKRFWLKKADAVIAVSNAMRKNCWQDAIVIPNPYRTELFKKLSANNRSRDFVFLGRLVSDKGVHLAVQAIHNLIKSGIETNLTIIGSGPENDNLQALVNKLNITPNVTFKGTLLGNDLVETLNKHKYIIIPSIWEEPFGLVAIEAMACGCIPIVSSGGGLPEAVGNAGIVFESGSLERLTNAITKLYTTPALERKLLNAMPIHLNRHHSDVITNEYIDIIQKQIK